MLCPFCGHLEDKVVDSRESKEGDTIRRRRECLGCGQRFTTYERTDEIPYMVVKKDGRLEELVNAVESLVIDSPERECATREIGELLMTRLQQIDKVAYVRFASVYRDFQDEREFLDELTELIKQKKSL